MPSDAPAPSPRGRKLEPLARSVSFPPHPSQIPWLALAASAEAEKSTSRASEGVKRDGHERIMVIDKAPPQEKTPVVVMTR